MSGPGAHMWPARHLRAKASPSGARLPWLGLLKISALCASLALPGSQPCTPRSPMDQLKQTVPLSRPGWLKRSLSDGVCGLRAHRSMSAWGGDPQPLASPILWPTPQSRNTSQLVPRPRKPQVACAPKSWGSCPAPTTGRLPSHRHAAISLHCALRGGVLIPVMMGQ